MQKRNFNPQWWINCGKVRKGSYFHREKNNEMEHCSMSSSGDAQMLSTEMLFFSVDMWITFYADILAFLYYRGKKWTSFVVFYVLSFSVFKKEVFSMKFS
jgi:hypothetical protein